MNTTSKSADAPRRHVRILPCETCRGAGQLWAGFLGGQGMYCTCPTCKGFGEGRHVRVHEKKAHQSN